MTRTWIAVAVVSCLPASVASAQVQHFTVSERSASVYKAPTNVSPVIGQATQGATFEVVRDIGSWVRVAWSSSPDGVGYIRKNTGTLSALGPAVPATPAVTSASAGKPAVAPGRAGAAAPVSSQGARRGAAAQSTPRVRATPAPAGYVAPTHRIGLGAQVGGAAVGGGFSARGWSATQKWGVQFDVMHYSVSNDVLFTTQSSTAAGPRLLYAFRDHVSDQTWIRPYTGLGVQILRSSIADPATGLSVSDTGMATQLVGGAEVTFSSVPKLGVSAELGYQWFQNPFAGYALNGMTFGLSAHWYLK